MLGASPGEPVLRRRALYGVFSFAPFSVLWTTLAFLLSGPPYGYGEGTIGLFGLVGAAGALTASVVGRFTRPRLGLLAHRRVGWLMLAGFVFLWFGEHSLAALLAGVVVLDVGSNGVHITNQSEIYRLQPEARSRVNAFYMTSCFVGRPPAPPCPPSPTTAGAGPAPAASASSSALFVSLVATPLAEKELVPEAAPPA